MADHVEVTDRRMMRRVLSSETKETRQKPVHRDMAKLTTRLMATAPRGSGKPLFRNSQEKPSPPTAGVARFIAISTAKFFL